MIESMEKEKISFQLDKNIKDNLSMEQGKDMESTILSMEINLKANGKTIYSMAKAFILMPMVLITKALG